VDPVSRRIDPECLEAWAAFLAAHSVVLATLEAEIESERGLPLAWYEVLYRLQKSADGSLRMNELADSLVVSRSGVTRLIDRMAGGGLIERAECPTDRRGKLAVITPTGREALRAASPVHMRGIKEHFTDHLSAADARTLRRVFDRVLRAGGQGAPAP